MEHLFEKTTALFEQSNRINQDNEREYYLIADFGESSVTGESGFINPMFRIFTPVKPEKGRKLNPIYGNSFNPFKETLMDYPTIVQYKLGKIGINNWEEYNRLISVHTALCPINCWHCYLEECLKTDCRFCSAGDYCYKTWQDEEIGLKIKRGWFTAKTILDFFLQQRKSDCSKNKYSNIIRITGGEPFLVPDLLLELLIEIKNQNLDSEIFVWTETNLLPLCVKKDDAFLIPDELLRQLSDYKNFCVHPCFHGINPNNFEENTGEKIEDYKSLIQALKRLVDAGIDVYPTFGSNVSNPDTIDAFFREVSAIHPMLPLRFYLIEFDLDYTPIKRRRDNDTKYKTDHNRVYNRFWVIDRWIELLNTNTGYRYGDLPRHLAQLKSGEMNTMTSIEQSTLHLFKRPSIIDYQLKFLHVLSLPYGVSGQIYYDVKWMDEDVLENKQQIIDNKIDAIFWVVDCTKPTADPPSPEFGFSWAHPIRILQIIGIDPVQDDQVNIKFIAKDFIKINSFITIKNIEILKDSLSINFNSSNKAPPCKPSGFAHIGPKFTIDKEQLSQTPNLSEIYELTKNIPSLNGQEYDKTLKEYPFFWIEGIKEKDNESFLTPNREGRYEFFTNKYYYLYLRFFQGDLYRTKPIIYGTEKSVGKSGKGALILKKFDESDNKIYFEVKRERLEFSDLIEFPLEIPIIVKKNWYERKFAKMGVLILISIILVGLFYFFINPEAAVLIGVITSVLVILINKFYEISISK